jgi:hypothetical protein
VPVMSERRQLASPVAASFVTMAARNIRCGQRSTRDEADSCAVDGARGHRFARCDLDWHRFGRSRGEAPQARRASSRINQARERRPGAAHRGLASRCDALLRRSEISDVAGSAIARQLRNPLVLENERSAGGGDVCSQILHRWRSFHVRWRMISAVRKIRTKCGNL